MMSDVTCPNLKKGQRVHWKIGDQLGERELETRRVQSVQLQKH